MPKHTAQVLDDPFADLHIEDVADQIQTALVRKSQESLSEPLQNRFRAMEDAINERFLTMLEDASYARDVDPRMPELVPPEEWKTLDPDERMKRLRIAMAAWENKKNAPVFLDLAARVVTGMAKARAAEKQVERPQLNVVAVIANVQMPRFEEIIVEREER